MSKSANTPAFQRDLCFIDVETTGSRIGYHEIIEIGVIRTCQNAAKVKTEWSRRMFPLYPDRITEVARRINGFSGTAWSQERATKPLWENFVEVVAGAVPICHNPSFERAFISLAASQVGVLELGLDHHWIGTESLAWPLVKRDAIEKFSLETLCRYFKLEPETHPHSATGGADACLRVYRRLMGLDEEQAR